MDSLKVNLAYLVEIELLNSLVLGDSIGIKDVAVAYQEAYGVEPKTQWLGSLDDLHDKLVATRKAQPQNIYAWMGL